MKHHLLIPILFCFSCGSEAPEQKPEPQTPTTTKTIGTVQRISPEMDAIVAPDAKIEVLAEGYTWAEGPLWVESQGFLLFTDVPENKLFKWKEGEGVSLYLTPSGFTGDKTDSPEPGGNGLTLDAQGNLLVCQHGDRRVARMAAPIDQPAPKFESVADKWSGKRFNSPNDLVFDKAGNLYFTDPPYGLKDHDKNKTKEIPFQGVYRRKVDGTVELLDSLMTRPNGIALTPDEKKLIVANSDPDYCYWKVFDVMPDGKVANGLIFYDATSDVKQGMKGLADGLKINKQGIVFATGPGGVLVLNKDGVLLGRINTGEGTANCALGKDEKVLYITADSYLCRIALK